MSEKFVRSLARAAFGAGLAALTLAVQPAAAEFSAMNQAIAEGVVENEAMAAFYRERDFAPIWTSSDDAERRNALLTALEAAGDHGLPVARYDVTALRAAFRNADTPYERGQAEVMATQMFLAYARDVQTGLIDPDEVVQGIVQAVPRRDQHDQLVQFVASDPHAFIRALPPRHPEYLRLMREKLRLERVLGQGGWGATVQVGRLEPGQSGPAVIALRDRLVRMGYLDRSATAVYDAAMTDAVMQFQADHGLTADGVAGQDTIEQINIGVEERLAQVILSMERQRWMNRDRGERHVLVNIPDFRAFVIDDEQVTFETRVVVGSTPADQRTPEFSDMMEHMVVNPSWYVPRSIAVNEYLPAILASQGAAAGHLQLMRGGQAVNRAQIDWAVASTMTPSQFPFDLRQPPGPGNALGRVKFMFPNRWNIYLHDTPSRSLFDREVRAFSHGCVRVHRPLELAYHLLRPQAGDNAEALFDNTLRSGQETQIDLETPIPVHLVYWTAFVTPDGRANYRRDIYGRNAQLWDAMRAAGVEIRAVTS
ncbi:L,D-transpeptidase family protein [Rhodobacterales bacterium HKCCE3408]|nr:L,D-transpeptidase family protein [Rhodobacterales bacterium HKCCE3408]